MGALDVAPVVYPDAASRGAACAEALTAGALIGADAGIPVFLYGALATAPTASSAPRCAPAVPRGWPSGWRAASSRPTSARPRCTRPPGATLVTARPPLIAFNVDLATDDVDAGQGRSPPGCASRAAGRRGVRAIGLTLPARGRAQVSFNVHDHRAAPLRDLVAAVRERAPVAEAELVGLAPAAAFDGFPDDVPLRGFDPERHLIENALRSVYDGTDKRKRKSRHRGTQAGTVEARGRTSRPTGERKRSAPAKKPANRAEAREQARQRRAAALRRAADLAQRAEPRRVRRRAVRRPDRRSPSGGRSWPASRSPALMVLCTCR